VAKLLAFESSSYIPVTICQYTQCVLSGRKKRPIVISPTKLRRFWWNLVRSFLNKFAAKSYKRFQTHLNNVSTLPYETWRAHCARATIELLEKKLRNLFHLNYGLQIRQIWIQLITECGEHCKRKSQNAHHWSDWERTEPSCITYCRCKNVIIETAIRQWCRG